MGAGVTRNISGNNHLHLLLEHEIADLHGREAALIFTSGYVANDAALSTLARQMPGTVVFSDALNHASMIAGIPNSRAEKHIFSHNGPGRSRAIAGASGPRRPKLVCLQPRPGVYLHDIVAARLAAGALAAIRHLKQSRAERERHEGRAATLRRRLAEAGLPVMPSPSHIVPVRVGDAGLCKAACDELLQRHHIYVQPINYPTVPRGTERLRLTPSPLHSDTDIEALVAGLSDVWCRLTA
jgi:7-keto-8-aminopelargonate synthetase-like enzyme